MNEQDRKITEKLRRCDECEDVEDCGYGNSYCGNKTIRDYCKIAANLIERQSAEIEELKNRIADAICAAMYNGQAAVDRVDKLQQENEEMRDQVHNLTMYLRDVIKEYGEEIGSDYDTILDYYMDAYDGMPGYNPTILEVQHHG